MDRRTESRLKREQVIWLVTASKDGVPQAVPVWFVWDGKTFLIYAQDGVKVRHIRENPNVELHLNTDEAGDIVVRAAGKATIERSRSAEPDPAYRRKYGRAIRDLGMTPDDFFAKYHNVIRIRSVRFH